MLVDSDTIYDGSHEKYGDDGANNVRSLLATIRERRRIYVLVKILLNVPRIPPLSNRLLLFRVHVRTHVRLFLLRLTESPYVARQSCTTRVVKVHVSRNWNFPSGREEVYNVKERKRSNIETTDTMILLNERHWILMSREIIILCHCGRNDVTREEVTRMQIISPWVMRVSVLIS